MEPNELRAALEAILFLSSDPVRLEDLAESLDEQKDAVTTQLEEIKRTLDAHVGGFMLEQAAGGWRLTTRAEHDSVLKKYFSKKGENRLSIAALETLAIVAYRQPITAPEISEIRGVNASGVIRTLLERRMIRVAGRKNVVGSPFLYRTTKDFLVHFGLNDIRDLPALEEFGDLIGENINDDLVAAINAAPETNPDEVTELGDDAGDSGEALADEAATTEGSDAAPSDREEIDAVRDERLANGDVVSDDVSDATETAGESDLETTADHGTTFEESPVDGDDETRLESSRSETNEE
jgi:segregation and condensation protein B